MLLRTLFYTLINTIEINIKMDIQNVTYHPWQLISWKNDPLYKIELLTLKRYVRDKCVGPSSTVVRKHEEKKKARTVSAMKMEKLVINVYCRVLPVASLVSVRLSQMKGRGNSLEYSALQSERRKYFRYRRQTSSLPYLFVTSLAPLPFSFPLADEIFTKFLSPWYKKLSGKLSMNWGRPSVFCALR